MKKTKNRFKIYAAWEYERETQDLREQSEKGWQLVKGGLFQCKFAFDDSVVYRYALDFNRNISDPARYREIFAEQGWEYVNSIFNGWHYFRKAYDPSLPQEEYQIYTDTSSREEMANRWRRIACILGVLQIVIGVSHLGARLFHPAIYSFCLTAGCIWLGILLIWSTRWINHPDRHRLSGRMWIPVFVLILTVLIYGSFRTRGFQTQQSTPSRKTRAHGAVSLT